jgi:hypothetical protein
LKAFPRKGDRTLMVHYQGMTSLFRGSESRHTQILLKRVDYQITLLPQNSPNP